MKITELPLNGLYLLEEEPLQDARGLFSRVFCLNDFNSFNLFRNGISQINRSLSKEKFTLRGIHFQTKPFQEAKYVRVKSGSIFDVAIDLRKSSKTFLKWHAETLLAGDNKGFYLSEGFGHGIMTLEPETEIEYFVSMNYSPNHERGLIWNDEKLKIEWPAVPSVISDKDQSWQRLDAWDLNEFE